MRRSGILLLILALAIPAWWLGLFVSPSFRDLFVAAGGWDALQSYLPADLGLALVTGGFAVRSGRGRPSPIGLGISCGGWGYATVMTCTATWTGLFRPASAVAMVAGLSVALFASHDLVSASHRHHD